MKRAVKKRRRLQGSREEKNAAAAAEARAAQSAQRCVQGRQRRQCRRHRSPKPDTQAQRRQQRRRPTPAKRPAEQHVADGERRASSRKGAGPAQVKGRTCLGMRSRRFAKGASAVVSSEAGRRAPHARRDTRANAAVSFRKTSAVRNQICSSRRTGAERDTSRVPAADSQQKCHAVSGGSGGGASVTVVLRKSARTGAGRVRVVAAGATVPVGGNARTASVVGNRRQKRRARPGYQPCSSAKCASSTAALEIAQACCSTRRGAFEKRAAARAPERQVERGSYRPQFAAAAGTRQARQRRAAQPAPYAAAQNSAAVQQTAREVAEAETSAR